MTLYRDSLLTFFFFPFQPGAVRRAVIFSGVFYPRIWRANFNSGRTNEAIRWRCLSISSIIRFPGGEYSLDDIMEVHLPA